MFGLSSSPGQLIRIEWFRFREHAIKRASHYYPKLSYYDKLRKVTKTKNYQGKLGYAVILPK